MRDGFKVFDADAHVVYPPDLWSRFLDKEFVDRVDRKPVAGFDHYNPVTVDGRYTQHLTSILGQFQKAINWTTDDMIAKYGEEIVTQGFTGERVAEAIAMRGRRRHGHLRPRVRHVVRGHRPRAPGRDGARVQPLGSGDARDVERAS